MGEIEIKFEGVTAGIKTLMKLVYLIVFVTVSTIGARITAFKMRRRIRRALGNNVSDGQLTSISTWMKVNDAEKRNRGGKLG